MNARFGSMADDSSISSRLMLKLDLSLGRETLLHFFDQVRKAFPAMTRFRRRDDGCVVLDEEVEEGASRRWVRLDGNSLRFGCIAPQSTDDIRRLADVVLDQAFYHLSFSEIDFDHLELVYGFDLEYRGNHDQLIAETFWADHPLAGILQGSHARHVIDAQPYFGVALTDDCDLQAYVEIKSRTSTFEVRAGDFQAQPLTVFLIVRKYWGVGTEAGLLDTHRVLCDLADELAASRVVPILVNPLAQAIASRS